MPLSCPFKDQCSKKSNNFIHVHHHIESHTLLTERFIEDNVIK